MNDIDRDNIPYNGKDKFNWKAGDFKATLPQCAYCERNTGAYTCEIYGDKPLMFSRNEEECPYKVIPKNSPNKVEEILDVRKSIVKLFNSKEYNELKLYYDFKGIFDILGIMRNENVHSNFLAWILNPDQHHGLSNYPMRKA